MNVTCPCFPVRFAYIDLNDSANDREWTANCHSVPRIGEKLRPRKDLHGYVVVRDVIHRFSKLDASDTEYYQFTTVFVGDPDATWPQSPYDRLSDSQET